MPSRHAPPTRIKPLGGALGLDRSFGRLLRRLAAVRRLRRRALSDARLGGLPLAPAATRLARRRLRGGQALRERRRDLLDRAELLARTVERAVGPRGISLGRGEQRRADRQGERGCDPHELRDVVLVTVSTRVRDRSEQPLRLRKLLARLAIERLANRAREPPCPAAEDLLGRVRLAVSDCPQEDADARGAVLLPRRRLRDESDEIVGVGALDPGRDPVGEGGHPQAAVRVLGGAHGKKSLERALVGPSLRKLSRELRALVEPDLAPGDRRPEPLLVVVQEPRVDALPLALDDGEPAGDVLRDRDEPRSGREAPARASRGTSAGGRG